MTDKILFIGAGNMASSLIGGLIKNGRDPASIFVADTNNQVLASVQQRFAIQPSRSPQQTITEVGTVVLAVKPQHIQAVCVSLAESLSNTKVLLLSIAAGIRIAAIRKWIASDIAIVRAMPNTPALVNCGASAWFANELSTDAQRQAAQSILAATGMEICLDSESQLDIVTALSGSGPAYFFRIMESLTKSAIALGLPAETARLLTLQTALGASKMAMQGDSSVEELRRRVTSPGGTTESGLQILEQNDIDLLMKQVLQAAQHRSVELADILGGK